MNGEGRMSRMFKKLREIDSDPTNQMFNPEFIYKPRAGDVVVFGPPKTGTTWLQMCLHQIRSKGDLSFDTITDSSFYIERPDRSTIDLNREQPFNPRVYQCHFEYGMIKSDYIKCVVVFRDPYDAQYSMSKFLLRLFGCDEDVGDEEQVQAIQACYDTHFQSYYHIFRTWWPHRNDPNVFLVFYEDMQKNLSSVVRQLAKFIGVNLTENEIENVLKLCSFEFMSSNEDKFRPRIVEQYNTTFGSQEQWTAAATVRKSGGQIGQGRKNLGPKTRAMIEKLWAERIKSELGFENYDEVLKLHNRFKVDN